MTEIKEIKKKKKEDEQEEEEGLEQLLEDTPKRTNQPQQQLDTENLILHSDESAPEIIELEQEVADAPSVNQDNEQAYSSQSYTPEKSYESNSNYDTPEQQLVNPILKENQTQQLTQNKQDLLNQQRQQHEMQRAELQQIKRDEQKYFTKEDLPFEKRFKKDELR